jgi:hypothetical protein
MLDEVARWDDLVTGLRPMTYGARGEPARCLVSVGPTTTAKASSEGWRLRLRPNTDNCCYTKILHKANFYPDFYHALERKLLAYLPTLGLSFPFAHPFADDKLN